MKRNGVEPELYERRISSFFEILSISSALLVQKIGVLCKNLFLGLKFTCNNIVLDHLTLLRMVVQRSKVYLAKLTVTGSSSSSSLFQSQRSLKSQLNRKQSMLTIISTGNREEAKWPKWSSSLLLPSLIKLRSFKMEFGKSLPNKYLQLLLNQIEVSYIYWHQNKDV